MAKKVVNAIKNPVKTVKKVASTAKKVVKELLKPDPKPSATRRTASPVRNQRSISPARNSRGVSPANKKTSSIDYLTKQPETAKKQTKNRNTSSGVFAGSYGKSAPISTAKPSVHPVTGTQRNCSAWTRASIQNNNTVGTNAKINTLNLNWHIDSEYEFGLYTVSTIGADIIAGVVAVSGIIAGAAAIPETLGASIPFAIASLEILSVAGIDFGYDVSSVINNYSKFKQQGEINVNVLGYVVPGIIVDFFDEILGGETKHE